MSNAPKSVVRYHEKFAYTHTQRGRVLLIVMLLPMVVCFLGAVSIPAQHNTLMSIGVVIALLAAVFSSLTVQVSDRFLHWNFGFGLVHKQVALAQIQHVEGIRTGVLDGWGIHYTKRGWLYNVSGFDAIAVTLQNGKQFVLGSNDVANLSKALANEMQSIRAAQAKERK